MVGEDEDAAASMGQTISVDLSELIPTADWVLFREPSTELFPVGDEYVLYSPNNGASLVLDAAAASVWQCFDGVASLSEIGADLSSIASITATEAQEYLVQFSQHVVAARVAARSPWVQVPSVWDGRLADPPSR